MYFEVKQTNSGSSYRGDGEYAEWREDNDVTPYALKVVGKKGYSDLALFPGQPEVSLGDDAFLVWASYGNGDSFGSSTGNPVFLWVFSVAKDAFDLQQALEEDYKDNPEYNFKDGNFITFKDVVVSTSTWKGYFERLEQVHVDKLTIIR